MGSTMTPEQLAVLDEEDQSLAAITRRVGEERAFALMSLQPDKLLALLKKLAQARLELQSGDAFCAYCNEGTFANDAGGLKRLQEHVEKICPLHPMRKLETELTAFHQLAGSPRALGRFVEAACRLRSKTGRPPEWTYSIGLREFDTARADLLPPEGD